VKAFVASAKLPDDPKAKSTYYYPGLPKSELFPDYIALVSGHSRGATVDLTVVRVNPPAEPAAAPSGAATPCTGAEGERAPDTSIELGTAFDCFDPKANTHVSNLTEKQPANARCCSRQ
jgi:D-alanyl-D-alanine dipeptidase